MIIHTRNSLQSLTLKQDNGIWAIAKSFNIKGIHSKKKNQLIDEILIAQNGVIQKEDDTEIKTKEETLTAREEDVEQLVSKSLTNLIDYVYQARQSQDLFSGFDQFLEAIQACSTGIKQLAADASQTGEIAPSTCAKFFTEVMGSLRKKIRMQKDFELCGQSGFIGITYQRFYQGVNRLLVEVKKAKRGQATASLNSRQNNVVRGEVFSLVTWAAEYLKVLPKKASAYPHVTVAIAILTGRRQSEILSSGTFEAIDEHTILFGGQLKRHDGERVDRFTIPCLASSAYLVQSAIEWLGSHGKRTLPVDDSIESQQLAAKRSHGKHSRYLSEAAKFACTKIVVEDDSQWYYSLFDSEGNPTGKQKDRRSFKLMRQIYAQIAPDYLRKLDPKQYESRKDRQIRASVMGHKTGVSVENQAEGNYDSDFTVIDLDKITNLIP